MSERELGHIKDNSLMYTGVKIHPINFIILSNMFSECDIMK